MQAFAERDELCDERRAFRRLVGLACRVLQSSYASLTFADPRQEAIEIRASPWPSDAARLAWHIRLADGDPVARLELIGRGRHDWQPAEMEVGDELAACIAHELDLQFRLANPLRRPDAAPIHHVSREVAQSGRSGSPTPSAPGAADPDAHFGEEAGSDTQARSARVLLADDLDLNRKLICDMLALEGHHVDGVADGREAVEAASRGGYDLILMDMIMPGMDGLAATREIRALPAPMCDVPIVALTANSFRDQLDSCIAAGMNGTLSKPLSLDTLTSAVAEWTRGRQAA